MGRGSQPICIFVGRPAPFVPPFQSGFGLLSLCGATSNPLFHFTTNLTILAIYTVFEIFFQPLNINFAKISISFGYIVRLVCLLG